MLEMKRLQELPVDVLDPKQKSTLRNYLTKNKSIENNRASRLSEAHRMKDMIVSGNDYLQQILNMPAVEEVNGTEGNVDRPDARTEKQIKGAIKYGKQCGLRGELADGTVYVTELMRQVCVCVCLKQRNDASLPGV